MKIQVPEGVLDLLGVFLSQEVEEINRFLRRWEKEKEMHRFLFPVQTANGPEDRKIDPLGR